MKNIIAIFIGLSLSLSSIALGATGDEKKSRAVKVEITEDGFKPAKIKAHKGEELVLLVTRKTDKTCMKELKTLDGTGEVKLPLNNEVRFEVGRLNKKGDIKLLCGMDMKAGVISVM